MTRIFICILLSLPTLLPSQIQLNNDEFNLPETLVNWQNINDTEGWQITQLENYNIGDTTDGQLFLLPNSEGWFGEYRGAYLFKEIAGDFILTTKVNMSARDGQSLPSSSYSLAGVMIRHPLEYPNQNPTIDWQPNEQNYIFLSVGRANQNRYSFEIKSTCNSRSCLNIVDANSGTVTMRLIRRGDELIVLSKFADEPWMIQNRYNRNGIQVGDLGSCGQPCNAPFPDTLQIGFVAYTDWEKISSYTTAFHNTNTLHPDSIDIDPTPDIPFNADLRTSYEYIRFDSMSFPPEWIGLDLSDPTEITDIEIINQFSFEDEALCPELLNIVSLPISDKVIHASASQHLRCATKSNIGANLYFQSQEEISLDNGFEICNGAILEASIASCPD